MLLSIGIIIGILLSILAFLAGKKLDVHINATIEHQPLPHKKPEIVKKNNVDIIDELLN